MITLADIQGSQFQTASGYCTNTQDYLDLVNLMIPRLLNRGDFAGSLLPIRVCVRNGCVTWPRYVKTVRRINHCRGNIPIHNVWHEWLPWEGERAIHGWQGWCGQERQMTTQYHAPTYNDIFGLTSTVRVIPALQQDIGATVTIFGTDTNNQPLQTDNGDGTWSRGITIAADVPFGSSTTFIGHIDRVVKSKTQGNLFIYGYDATQNAMYDLAVYEPSETNPSYIRYQLDGQKRHTSQSGCQSKCTETIIALVKLQFIPVVTAADGLIFLDGAQGALLLAIRATKLEEAGNYAGAKEFWAGAVEELNRQLEDFSPDSQMAVSNNVFGAGRTFGQRIF